MAEVDRQGTSRAASKAEATIAGTRKPPGGGARPVFDATVNNHHQKKKKVHQVLVPLSPK